jgi:geranylgeranyl diphosphate synthase type I
VEADDYQDQKQLESSAIFLANIRSEFETLLGQCNWLQVPSTCAKAANYALFQSGNRMRPLLALSSYAAIRGDWHDPQIIDFAILLEWFHKTSLVLDDILDDDEFRKGKPTLHRAFGQNPAFMTGIAMLCVGYDGLARKNATAEWKAVGTAILDGLNHCLVGQAEDISWNHTVGNVEAYFTVIAGKTASLSKLALQIAGLLAQGSEQQVSDLANYGFSLGMGYQILNDLKNFIGIEDVTGKGKKKDTDVSRPNIVSALAVEHGWQAADWTHDPEKIHILVKTAEGIAEEQFRTCLRHLENSRSSFYEEYYECFGY